MPIPAPVPFPIPAPLGPPLPAYDAAKDAIPTINNVFPFAPSADAAATCPTVCIEARINLPVVVMYMVPSAAVCVHTPAEVIQDPAPATATDAAAE